MGRSRVWSLGGSLVLILAVSGCGTSGSTTKAPAAVARASSAPQPAAAAPARHLTILLPRPGAHTGATVTVRVTLSGAATTGGQRFRYVLDHRLTRSGSHRLTFHDLAPGRHRLEVIWAGGGRSRTATTFTVRAPVPVAIPAPAQAQPTVSTPAPQPMHTTPAQTPPPTTTTAPAPPKAVPPQSGGGIPQGPNAGDGDSDNRGGPSDGDGNV